MIPRACTTAFVLALLVGQGSPRIAGMPADNGLLAGQAPSASPPAAISEASVRAHMEVLAGDEMRGRRTGSRGMLAAAEYVTARLAGYGLEPVAADGSFYERFPLDNRLRRGLDRDDEAKPAELLNVVAELRGSDPARRGEYVMLSAHLDHIGVAREGSDRINNGADDNASGATALLAIAEALGRGPRPPRTVLFVWFDGEEAGSYGARRFVDRADVPLERIVVNLNFEMIGRPDPAVAPGTLWMTGYERSTLGPALAAGGARIVADPHPSERFFERSDNIVLARRGVVAHTLSSYGLHADYHRPVDDVARVDFDHLTRVIDMVIEPIRWLATSSFVPTWNDGMAPATDGPRAEQ